MSRKGDKMKALQDMEEEYLREISKHQQMVEMYQHKLNTVRDLRNRLSGSPAPIAAPEAPSVSRKARNVKGFVMEIIVKRGESGVTAEEIVLAGAEQGKTIQKTSVSSLLSRLKAEKTLRYDGTRYFPVNVSPAEQMSFPKLAAVK